MAMEQRYAHGETARMQVRPESLEHLRSIAGAMKQQDSGGVVTLKLDRRRTPYYPVRIDRPAPRLASLQVSGVHGSPEGESGKSDECRQHESSVPRDGRIHVAAPAIDAT